MSAVDEQRARVVAVARSWLGTPFHDVAGVKGVGVDCAHLVERVYSEAEVMEPLPIEPYAPQWMLHQSEEKFLGYILQRGHEIQENAAAAGDMAIFKVGRCFSHGAIIVSWPDEIVHAWKPAGVVTYGPLREFGDLVDREVRFFSLW